MSLSENLQVINKSVDTLKPYDRNARTHSDKQLKKIADSIKVFGFNNPILIDENARIIAGHGRAEAAKRLGLKTVPTIQLDHMSEDEKRAYILADNKLAELAGWDNETLAIELQHLTTIDLDFDVEITGFATPEIDLIIGDDESEPDPDDVFALPPDEPPITQPGDIWEMGNHRLICGDALKPETYAALMPDEKAQMVFSDAPYNVKINGNVSGTGRHDEFAMASGEMSRDEFTSFLKTAFTCLTDVSEDSAIHFQCMDWRHMREILDAADGVYAELKNLCVWAKDNAGMGSFYRSRHELVFVFKYGTAPHINNFELGQHGRYRSNVWEYAGMNSYAGRNGDEKLHPTVKPVAMVADAIKDCSKRGRIVLDPFGGSGSTLIAAERTGRAARLIELDPRYCDVIVRRWQDLTGDQAIHREG